MKTTRKSNPRQAEILREYGPYPGMNQVNGVTFDGTQVWFARGESIVALDPKSGALVRELPVTAEAGTAFDGEYLWQLADDRIQKVDPRSGQVVATIPARAHSRDSGRRDALGWRVPRPQDPPDRRQDRRHPAHHRIGSFRHRRLLGQRRTLARHHGSRAE